MPKVLITTIPFGDKNKKPLQMLNDSNIEYVINPFNKKITESELISIINEFDGLIAGTEPITKDVLNSATNLKIIGRVGIGLDNVDLQYASKKNIMVTYTPDAPAPAVAELTIAIMLSLLRSVHISNDEMHNGRWHRFFGRRLSEVEIGIIGLGRIGTRVIKHIRAFNSKKIMVNDLNTDKEFYENQNLIWTSKEDIYKKADVISLHLPLTKLTSNMINFEKLLLMKKDAIIINTSRGGIVNEKDLYEVMKLGKFCGVGIDVFDKEPYNGPLNNIQRCLLTSHMGSMSEDCRSKMEIEATQDVINYFNNDKINRLVPEYEYQIQQNLAK